MSAAYRDRAKPAATLIEWEKRSTHGYFNGSRLTAEAPHYYKYVMDVDGFVFRREIIEDRITRWEKVISPNSPRSREQVLERAEEWMGRMQRNLSTSKGDYAKVIQDNREA